MPDVVDTIEIRAPIERVFAAVTDPRRSTEWNANIVEVLDVSEGPPRLGTTWRQVAVVAGRRVTLNCQITEWRPPHTGVLLVSGPQQGRIQIDCRQNGLLTVVTQTLSYQPPGGVFGQLAGGMLGPMFKRELAQSLARQRDTLEREAR